VQINNVQIRFLMLSRYYCEAIIFSYLCAVIDENLNIQSLVQKYEQGIAFGKKLYLDAEEFVLLAEHYNTVGDDDTSVNLIEEGLIMHPTNPELMLLKAKILVFGESYEEAMEYMKNITDDEDIELILLKIEALLHLKRDDEAMVLFEKISDDLAEDDENKDVFYTFITELGYIYNDVDLYDKAIILLEESLLINNENTEVYVDLAYSYEMKGDFETAIQYNNQLLDLDPYSFEAWINLGKLYSMCDDFDKAVSAFDFALTIKDHDLSALKMKAFALLMGGNSEQAVRVMKDYTTESPQDATFYNALLDVYEAMEQYDEMLHLLDKKSDLFDGSDGITIKKAFIYLAQDDLQNAKKHFLQVPYNEQDTFDYYVLEGELAFCENDFTSSEAAYLKALVFSEDNPEIIDRLANISVAQEKFEQAADYLEQLLAIDPEFPTAKARLAFIRFEIGTKEPFDEIMIQFSDTELRSLFNSISGNENVNASTFNREKILSRLNEARENRVLFKNMKY
jgi:tetratricopeptide (TPR) repeat protein